MGRIFRNLDWLILIPLLILGGLSLGVLASPGDNFFLTQFGFLLVGFFLLFFFSLIDWQIYKSLANIFLIISIVLLIVTFFGPHIRGASRWVEIFGVRWQPSELVKPLIIIFLANFFSENPPKDAKNLFLGAIIFLVPLFLVFRQPDLGNTIVLAGMWVGILYGSGLSFFWGASLLSFFLILLPLGWHFLRDYQKARITTFLNPFIDPSGAGYNSIQAMIAVGSGQLLGRGLGQGSQSHLLFLPEYHTDFIFASLSEELGFWGGALVILAYGVLLFRLLQISGKTRDPFAHLFVIGVFSQILFQVFINIGMNLGFVPITGITLPLLSYGGSSITATMITLGIVLNINKEEIKDRSIDIFPPG